MVGGGGGGRPDFAQAGGKDPEKLPDALAAVEEAVREQLGTVVGAGLVPALPRLHSPPCNLAISE